MAKRVSPAGCSVRSIRGLSMVETVLVTGGTGFVAGWCIVELLKRGYAVRTTVRSLSKEQVVRATISASIDPGDRLTVFAADLTSDVGWDAAVAGCDYVLHVASPLGVDSPKDPNALIVPARRSVRPGALGGEPGFGAGDRTSLAGACPRQSPSWVRSRGCARSGRCAHTRDDLNAGSRTTIHCGWRVHVDDRHLEDTALEAWKVGKQGSHANSARLRASAHVTLRSRASCGNAKPGAKTSPHVGKGATPAGMAPAAGRRDRR